MCGGKVAFLYDFTAFARMSPYGTWVHVPAFAWMSLYDKWVQGSREDTQNSATQQREAL